MSGDMNRRTQKEEEEGKGKKREEVSASSVIKTNTALFPLPLHIITLPIAYSLITVILLLREEPYGNRCIAHYSIKGTHSSTIIQRI